jgi:hypothetical protein
MRRERSGRKGRENIFFWLVAISVMVLAMCVLSLQIIELNQRDDFKKLAVHPKISPAAVSEKPVEEEKVFEEPKKPKPSVDRRPNVMPSKAMRTPKLLQKFGRVLYDVPHDGNCGFWAILRGLNPDDELIHMDEVINLKYRAAKCAARTKFGPSRQEIVRMFGGNEWMDTGMLPYISHALGRDIIVSASNKIFGYYFFTDKGEAFHYDSIDEIRNEAANEETIWLHNIDSVHWTVAIYEGRKIKANEDDEYSDDSEKHETYFLVNPPARP